MNYKRHLCCYFKSGFKCEVQVENCDKLRNFFAKLSAVKVVAYFLSEICSLIANLLT